MKKTYAAPQNDLEKHIAEIWQEVLQLDRVGSTDNFFELGGHSISIIQVHEKLQEVIERTFPLAEMFKYPTVSSLAQYLSQEDVSAEVSREKMQDRIQKQREALKRHRERQSKQG